jgi:hypothetical protein
MGGAPCECRPAHRLVAAELVTSSIVGGEIGTILGIPEDGRWALCQDKPKRRR